MMTALLRDPRARPATLAVKDAAACHPGLVRPANEDAFLLRPDVGVWAVADGMGGHEGGGWASDAVVEALGAARFGDDWVQNGAAATDALARANAAILERSRQIGARMGSTVVALVLGPRAACVLWAGDSRAYRLRDGALSQLTRDHTQVQERVDQGLMSPAAARSHPMAHVLTRAVGAADGLQIDRSESELAPGDVFLLCSDGLHGVADADEIAAALAMDNPDAARETLLRLVLARGAPDNVTVIVVRALG